MTQTIDAIFENGVFRPLQSVALPEQQRVRLQFEEESQNGAGEITPPRLPPREYLDEPSLVTESDLEYVSMPPKSVHQVRVKVIHAGRLLPKPYPDEE
jgi:Protein of unknown function DUF104